MTDDYWLYELRRGDTLTSHEWFPLHHHDLLSSAFVLRACAEGRRADVGTAMLLWAEAMRQNPAGTLPVSDVELAALAKFGADLAGWQAVREGALYGWSVCHVYDPATEETSERLGHRVIARIACEMSQRKRRRVAGATAGAEATARSRIRKVLMGMAGINPAWGEIGVVEELRKYLDHSDLHINADNLRVGLQHVVGVTADFRARSRT